MAIGLSGVIATEPARGSGPPRILYASNYREKAPERGRWSFFFDTTYRFPEDTFEHLASHFPALHFDCGCIDSLDDYMGYGWFNVPQGGEPFRQDFAVPKNYWTSGDGYKRTPAERAMHKVVVERLVQAASGCDQRMI